MMRNRQRTPEAGREKGGVRMEASGGWDMIVGMGESLRITALPLGGRGGDWWGSVRSYPRAVLLSVCVFVCVYLHLLGRWTKPRPSTRRWTTPKCGSLPRSPSLTRPSSLTPRSGRFARSCPSTGFTPPIRLVRERLGWGGGFGG